MKQKLIMILGVQRSGTTALFNSLATSPGLTSYHEEADDPIYFDYYLRPEPEIRAVLQAAPGAVLLKPVRESELRGAPDLLEEYAGYDLRMIWLYRDPVNLFYSYYRMGWVTLAGVRSLPFQWVLRNQVLVEALSETQGRVTVVRYEDLIQDPELLHLLAQRLGLQIRSTLRPDSNAGRKKLPAELQASIDQITSRTLSLLDEARTLRPAQGAYAPRSMGEGIPTGDRPAGPSSTRPVGSGGVSSIRPDLCSLEMQRDPYACFRRWREVGAVHALPWQNSWLVLNYEYAAMVLGDRVRFALPGIDWIMSPLQGDGTASERVCRSQQVAQYFNQESGQEWATRWAQCARRLFTACLSSGEFDWMELCRRVMPPFFGYLLGIESDHAEPLFEMIDQGAPWDLMKSRIGDTGLLTELAASGLWSPDGPGLPIGVSRHLCHIVCGFLGNALHRLLMHPAWMGTIHRQPELLPDLVTELLRLMPPLLTVKCVARCEAVIGDVTIPAGGIVYVAPGAANRDPAMFERPDELSLHRPPPHPIVFGVSAGAQPCVGEGLACLVAATVFKVLLTEFPPLLAAQPLTSIVFTNHRIWEDFMVLRAPYRLMVTFGGTGATH